MSLPPELTITIEAIGKTRFLAKVTCPNGDEICQHRFSFKPGLLVDIEPQWMLEKAIPRNVSEWTKRGPADVVRDTEQSAKLATYGQRLYQFLFGKKATAWKSFLKHNDIYRREARVTISLHKNAALLWQLPWEYLHDGDDFLALNGRFWLTRKPYGLGDLNPPIASPPIRLLVVVSAPDDQDPLDTEEEIGVIQQALDEAVRAGRIQVKYLDDATLANLGAVLREFKPHILHYTGHGAYDPKNKRSFLALEDDDGKTVRAGIDELRPHLHDAPDLRLVLLSGCQTARTSEQDAFRGVATGLLERDIPAVLAMQFSILDQSGIELARAFYGSLVAGESPEQSLQRTRLALWQFNEGPGFDWGIPTLYLRAGGMRLVPANAEASAPTSQPVALVDMGGLPLPPHFVGRKAELRALRKALRDPNLTAAYVRGIGGIGKSSLVAKLLERPGPSQVLDAPPLVIRCHEVDPFDIPSKVANYLSAQGKDKHAEAASLLLDSRQPPTARARQALEKVAEQRYLLVFDNFESVTSCADEASALLLDWFSGLLAARWRGTLLFTSRFPWSAMEEHLGRGTALERELNDLTARQAIMLMDNLPRLRKEPLATKIAVYKKVGGHPKSLELLEGWLASGRIADLLVDPSLDGLLREAWENYFLKALLAQLTPAECEALECLSVFETALDDEVLNYFGITPEVIQHWSVLSLVQRQQGATPFILHPLVRDYLQNSLPTPKRVRLHAWAAEFYGQPFIDIARQSVRSDAEVTAEQIETFARSNVVEGMVTQTTDMKTARSAMTRALQWQAQLIQTGQYEAAGEIVTSAYQVLARWGERDRAKVLLNKSIQTQGGLRKAVTQGNLANMLQDEGKLTEALAIHENLYETFAALDPKQQGTALQRQGDVLILTQVATLG